MEIKKPIIVETSENHGMGNVYKWCYENCSHFWYPYYINGELVMCFEKEEDATIFKLRWQ